MLIHEAYLYKTSCFVTTHSWMQTKENKLSMVHILRTVRVGKSYNFLSVCPDFTIQRLALRIVVFFSLDTIQSYPSLTWKLAYHAPKAVTGYKVENRNLNS
jgi:hypothetical protein